MSAMGRKPPYGLPLADAGGNVHFGWKADIQNWAIERMENLPRSIAAYDL